MFKPSNNHVWVPSHKILARAEINGSLVKIFNIRNFQYRTKDDFDVHYYDKTFDLQKIKEVQLGVVPFSKFKHIAHLLTVFEFENGDSVVFSVERRQRRDQVLNSWLTVLPAYTLMYVVADKNDVITLREKHRTNEPVHLKTLKVSQAEAATIFLDFCERLNELSEKPEFFHFIFNSCSSNAIKHLNTVLTPKIPKIYGVWMPGFLHKFLARKKLLGEKSD